MRSEEDRIVRSPTPAGIPADDVGAWCATTTLSPKPVMAGHGCSEPGFWGTLTPFEEPLPGRDNTMRFGLDADSGGIGAGVMGVAAPGIALHAGATLVRSALERGPSQQSGAAPEKEQ